MSLDSNPAATTATDYLSSPRWSVPYLVCVPTQSIRFPWTVLSGALIENNVVSLVISGSVLFFGGRYLERAWGTKEFGKFVLFVSSLSLLSTRNPLTFGQGNNDTQHYHVLHIRGVARASGRCA